MNRHHNSSAARRQFIIQATGLAAGTFLAPRWARSLLAELVVGKKPRVFGHLWVYASKYPPHWDCTPDLEKVFADFNTAGMDGVELMEVLLRHDDAVQRLRDLSHRYKVPVSGTSYGTSLKMWSVVIMPPSGEDVRLIVSRLSALKGKTFGISVGDAGRRKSVTELDSQATLLQDIMAICEEHGIEANLHNHTYEVVDGLHDLKGTLSRLPAIKLGPDMNWLIRGGVNPVEFITEYGKQISYMHLRDQYADGSWTEYLGQGVTDFTAIAAALQATHFKGNAAIELAFPNDLKPVNSLAKDWQLSREFVRKIFKW